MSANEERWLQTWHDFVKDPHGRMWHDPYRGRAEPACAVCGVGESRAIHHHDVVRGRAHRTPCPGVTP